MYESIALEWRAICINIYFPKIFGQFCRFLVVIYFFFCFFSSISTKLSKIFRRSLKFMSITIGLFFRQEGIKSLLLRKFDFWTATIWGKCCHAVIICKEMELFWMFWAAFSFSSDSGFSTLPKKHKKKKHQQQNNKKTQRNFQFNQYQ